MKRILVLVAAVLVSISAVAQSTGELLRFSRYNFSNSTARSAAMGGAFTSLGADLSSMSLNPAGLAMYKSSEVAATIGVNSHVVNANYGGVNASSQSNTKFIVPNVGSAMKFGDFVVGFGFNRLADFNSSMSVAGNYEEFNSVSRQWVDQLQGVKHSTLNDENKMFNQNPMQWNAVMGYESFVLEPMYGTTDKYALWYHNKLNGNNYSVIDPLDMIASQIEMHTNGAIDEFVLSGAYSFNDKFYLGATLGFQSIMYSQSSLYSEYTDQSVAYGDFNDMHISNGVSMYGFGFNVKLGATYQPLPWLRVGVAYHSPTWISMSESSASEMDTFFDGQTDSEYSYTPDLVQNYNMSTPGRLMAGVSATLFNCMIISFDYELTSYNEMRYDTDINTYGWRPSVLSSDVDNLPTYSNYMSSDGDIAMNNMIKDSYSSTNNYRVGIEVTPTQGLFLRAGFAYSDSPYAAVESFYTPGAQLSDYEAITRFSGGIGYRSKSFNIDLAYVYSTWNALPNTFFDYITVNAYNTGYNYTDTNTPWIIPEGQNIVSEQNINQTNYDHNIVLTASWRF